MLDINTMQPMSGRMVNEAGETVNLAATLNSGAGALPLTMAPIRLRSATLLPAASVAAGLLGGTFEYDGTHLYFTTGTTRNTII